MNQPSICLYGTIEHGAGYLARFNGQTYGDGKPHPCVNFTAAVRHACATLLKAGAVGTAIVFAPNGDDTAEVELLHPKAFGALPWRGYAPVWVISAEELIAAALPNCEVCGLPIEGKPYKVLPTDGMEREGVLESCATCWSVFESAVQVEEDGFGGGDQAAYEARLSSAHAAVEARIALGRKEVVR